MDKVYIVFEGNKMKVFKEEDKAWTYYNALKFTNTVDPIRLEEHDLL